MDSLVSFLNSGALVAILALFVSGQIVSRAVVADIARAVAHEILRELARDERLRTRVRAFALRADDGESEL